MAKRLYRSKDSKVIAGVCGGLGDYLEIDPVIVRIVMVLLVFAHGIGLLAYIVCWIAMPKASATEQTINSEVQVEGEPKQERNYDSFRYLPGIILVTLGVVFLFGKLFWWFSWKFVWPVLLIIGGGWLLYREVSRSAEKRKETWNESVSS